MPTSFENETKALVAAVHGRPVNFSDVDQNISYVKGETGSANHKLGSNPAWWLDCQRRGDGTTVAKGLDWSRWYASEAPLYENESMTCSPAYRTRIDQGTYALAMFAEFAGATDLRAALLSKCKLSVAFALFGAFPRGNAKKLVNDNPQPAHVATLLTADGPLYSLPGDTQGNVPYVACAGMRSFVRDGAGHNGRILYMNDTNLQMLLAQALGFPYKKPATSSQVDIFDTIMSRSQLPPWGLSVADIELGRDFLNDKLNVNLAARVLKWIEGGPLPKLPYAIVQRDSGAVEFIQLRSQSSSTGAKQAEVVLSDGTRYIGSADNGMRGGAAGGHNNIQPQEVIEYDDKWVCRWISGQGEVVEVPRPAITDKSRWRVNVANGNALLVVLIPPIQPPVEPPIEPPVEPEPGAGPLTYLGTTSVPGEHLYGSTDPNLTIREIHGDPASGYPKRWIAE